jgi:hypothetical protein
VIHKLLHQEGYTIAGARKRVRELRGEPTPEPEVAEAVRELALRAELIQVRNDLAELLATLDTPRAAAEPKREPSATVTAVVPKTALIAQRKLTF